MFGMGFMEMVIVGVIAFLFLGSVVALVLLVLFNGRPPRVMRSPGSSPSVFKKVVSEGEPERDAGSKSP